MSALKITYDGVQHATALIEPQQKTVAMDACPATGGKGEEFSPSNLVGAGLVGCMVFSMGLLARRDNLDISGLSVDVEVSLVDKPVARIGAIHLTFSMPRAYSEIDQAKLERASSMCPIKSSFHPDVNIDVRYNYPGASTQTGGGVSPQKSKTQPHLQNG